MQKKFGKIRWLLLIIIMLGMGMIISGSESKAAYKIRINKQQNCVTIYKTNEEGKLEPYKAMVCSVGAATPLGTFPLKEKIRWHTLDGPVYGQYCTRITGHILFHSVWYAQNNNPATVSCTQYNKLGQVASHGCVRLCVRDSKWIYDNVPFGTPVEIYNSKDPGPLGKPEAIKLPGAWGWDPTDVTNPNNPYNNKKPVITFNKEKSKLIGYATKVNHIKNITAKNTTGFDAIKKVTYTVKYKAKEKDKLKKVKDINTRKSGIYVVTYKLTDEIDRKASLTVKYKVVDQVFLKSISLNNTDKTLYLGGNGKETSFRIKVKAYKPAKASIKDVTFKSYNTNVATVDSKGNVKARGTGTTFIRVRAKDGSKVKAVCRINVRRYAESMTAYVDAPVITAGNKTAVHASLAPANATGKENMTITYSSSNPAVATVDAAGNITGLAPGTAVITVTASNAAQKGNLTAEVVVTVNPAQVNDASPSAIGL